MVPKITDKPTPVICKTTSDGILLPIPQGTKIAILPEDTKIISRHALKYCKDTLEQVICKGKVKFVLPASFASLPYLTSIEFQNGVKHIDDFAFYNCKNLKYFLVKKNLQHIGESCFEKCINLKFLNILDTIKYIDEYAFKGCHNLEIKIAKNLSKIELPNNNYKLVQYHLAETAMEDCELVTDKYVSIIELMIAGTLVAEEKKKIREIENNKRQRLK